jgi:hypothetical protein
MQRFTPGRTAWALKLHPAPVYLVIPNHAPDRLRHDSFRCATVLIKM